MAHSLFPPKERLRNGPSSCVCCHLKQKKIYLLFDSSPIVFIFTLQRITFHTSLRIIIYLTQSGATTEPSIISLIHFRLFFGHNIQYFKVFYNVISKIREEIDIYLLPSSLTLHLMIFKIFLKKNSFRPTNERFQLQPDLGVGSIPVKLST